MVDIVLKHLSLTNFKGIRDLKIDFTDGINEIKGANATGKTSLFDAFVWLLFGKDSQGRKDFGVKTLDADGKEIHRIEHNVTAIISVNGVDKVFSRTLREKWQTEKGKTEEVYKGNETIYEIDNVPLKMSEYNSRIADLLDEELFKLATNPTAFVSLKTQEQRKILMNMAGLKDDLALATECGNNEIVSILNSGKSLVDRAKELSKTRTKIRKELDLIPARIDEVSRSIGEHRNIEIIDKDISIIKNDIEKISAELEKAKSCGSANKIRLAEIELEQAEAEYRSKQSKVNAENNNIKYKRKCELDSIRDEISIAEKTVRDISRDISDSKRVIERKRAEYTEIRKDEYPAFNDTACPCCGRPWESETLAEKRAEYEEKRKEHNINRAELLSKINADGAKYAQIVKDYETKILEKQEKVKKLKAELKALEDKPLELIKLEEFDAEPYIAKINEQKANAKVLDTTELDNLKTKLEEFEREKLEVIAIDKQKQRIIELENDAKVKAQAIADIQKEENVIEDFTKFKINELDKAINNKFEFVKFKLYDYQINGGFVECCEPTINGVPYNNLNSAAKINAGLDIIKALQKFYGARVPVFVDGKESVNKVFETGSQLICLTVSKDTKLTINQEVA